MAERNPPNRHHYYVKETYQVNVEVLLDLCFTIDGRCEHTLLIQTVQFNEVIG